MIDDFDYVVACLSSFESQKRRGEHTDVSRIGPI